MTAGTAMRNPRVAAGSVRGRGLRSLVESLVCLALAVVLFRAFEVEGYMVSTGSMAPHLLGFHKRVVCPKCGHRFAFGVSFENPASRDAQSGHADVVKRQGTHATDGSSRDEHGLAACPNCGQGSIDVSAVLRNQGDQLLVHKHAYLFQPPRRWEVVVFRNPNRPTQAYVKRVVGLPGEAVRIRDGDVFIDGELQRKPPAVQRAVRILVSDHDHRPRGVADSQPRWIPEPNGLQPDEPHWKSVGSTFLLDDGRRHHIDGLRSIPPSSRAWVEYRHWRHDGQFGPITDGYAYNGPAYAPASVPVRDLMLSAEVSIQRGDGQFVLQMTDGRSTFDCEIDAGENDIALYVNREARPVRTARMSPETLQQPMLLEMSLFDRQVIVGVNGRQAFDGWKMPVGSQSAPDGLSIRDTQGAGTGESVAAPVRFGAWGLTVSVGSLKVYRDVYYRSDAPATARNGIEEPFRLGSDQYFVLGDNSPVSSDSRCWPNGAVPKRLLLGKPLVVHLPSRPGKVRIGHWTAYIRIPDFARIRYIR